MSNKILHQTHTKTQHSKSITTSTSSNINSNNGTDDVRGKHIDNTIMSTTQKNMANQEQQSRAEQPSNILNVAEMLLHGVADNEILTIWLKSVACQEFAPNFLDAGYDMPTISRITPQDLTAIGITDPTKRSKILSEIKKLNLQDGIPGFKPTSLSHWLSLLRLDSHYNDLLCDQKIDTIEKLCQLTWEDFEELGITKLGHQKRLILAIERMKEIEANEDKASSKPISEPIYDTNPSQILLVASAENHCMNGPIINKQSSTSELSSTGSGSMHSVYSANSTHYQPTYAALPQITQHPDQNQGNHQKNPVPNQQQAIYSQPPSQIHQVPLPAPILQQQTPLMPPPAFSQQIKSSHYQASQPISSNQLANNIYDTSSHNKRHIIAPQSNRQSLGQLPFCALANLPKHQQQLLQQSSIYATLGRQPQRVKQPPPPVPIRTNSLKSNSLVDEESIKSQMASTDISTLQPMGSSQCSSIDGLFTSGSQLGNKNQTGSQTLLTKNKSFKGNAFMDAARARFLDRNNYYQQLNSTGAIAYNHLQSATPDQSNQNGTHKLSYGMDPGFNRYRPEVGRSTMDSDSLSLHSRQSLTLGATDRSNTFNLRSSDFQTMRAQHYRHHIQQQQRYSTMVMSDSNSTNNTPSHNNAVVDETNSQSDASSLKSLMLQPNNFLNSTIINSRQASLSQDSGSSQTLYNSASSGSSAELKGCHLSQSGELASRHSGASNSTLNDANLTLDQTIVRRQDNTMTRTEQANPRNECDATTGKDDDFPPPPSPLSLTDSDEHDLLSLTSDKNFADINNRLMAFKVGI